MTVTLEVPEALARQLGPEAERGRFLGIGRIALDQFLNDHGVELDYTWEELERAAICR